MKSISVNLPDERMGRLEETATKLGINVEELIQKSIDEFLDRQKRIDDAGSYVLTKNAELYRRLAQ